MSGYFHRIVKLFVTLALLGGLSACANEAKITSTGEAQIVRLDERFSTLARLGNLPIPLDPESVLLDRYAVYPASQAPFYFVVVLPKEADGEIVVPQPEREAVESATRYNPYLDELLAIHRTLLRGDLTETKNMLDRLDLEFKPTYGSLLLRANVAHLEGRLYDAQRNYKRAKTLHPEGDAVKSMEFPTP